MAKAAQITIDQLPVVVSTSDGTTTTTIQSVPAFAAAHGGQEITFDVVGYDFDNDETASAKISVKLKSVGGVATIIGTPVHIVPIQVGSSTGLSTASVNVVISGSSLNVRVIGVTGRTIYWTCTRWPSVQVLDGYTTQNPINLQGITAGGDLTGTYPNPTVAKIQNNTVTSGALTTGRFLISTSTSNWANTALSGDISGSAVTPGLITVGKIQGNAIKAETPGSGQNGYLLTWVNANNRWEAQPVDASAFSLTGDVTGTSNANVLTTITGTVVGFNNTVEAGTSSFGVNGIFTLTKPSISTAATGDLAKLVIQGATNTSTGYGGTVYINGGVSTGGGTGGHVYIGVTAAGTTSSHFVGLYSTANMDLQAGNNLLITTINGIRFTTPTGGALGSFAGSMTIYVNGAGPYKLPYYN